MTEELEEINSSKIDEYIWRHIGRKSPREIAEETGLDPIEVLRRKNELLEEVDVLTLQQKQQKLMIELDSIAADARDRFRGASDEFASGLLNTSVAAIKTLLVEVNRIASKQTDAVERLNSMRVRELLRLVDKVITASVEEISEEHGLDSVEIMGVFQDKLVEEARSLDGAPSSQVGQK